MEIVVDFYRLDVLLSYDQQCQNSVVMLQHFSCATVM